jgi:hypothetical protein
MCCASLPHVSERGASLFLRMLAVRAYALPCPTPLLSLSGGLARHAPQPFSITPSWVSKGVGQGSEDYDSQAPAVAPPRLRLLLTYGGW